jgi:hypothetical protein
MSAGQYLSRQLSALDDVLEILEQMNVHHKTGVPPTVTKILEESGLSDTSGLEPMDLLPMVLRRQQDLRRQMASSRRAKPR